MSSSSASNLHGGDEVSHQVVGQPPPLPPPQASGSSVSAHHHPHLLHLHHQQKPPPPPPPQQQQQQQQPVESHYKNLPSLGKPSSSSSSSLYQASQQHQGTNSSTTNHPHGSTQIYAQRSDFWSPVTSITTPPPPTPDDELLAQLSLDELISRIRSLETKNRKLLYDNGSMTKDINHHLSSLQQMKQQNNHLLVENNELRELACFLEDERARCRSIAREWQSFGTHTSRVMRHEVTNYSNKLTQLEGKQFELVRENFELKQLCLLLDNALSTREGSESSLLTTMESHNPPAYPNGLPNANSAFTLRAKSINGANNTTLTNNAENNAQPQHQMILSQQILGYIRSLEERIKQLETEKAKTIENHSRPINNHCESTYENTSALNNNSNLESDLNRNQSSGSLLTCPQPLLTAMQALRLPEDIATTENTKNSNTTTTSTSFTTTITNNNNINSTPIDNRNNPSTINDNANEIINDQHKASVKGLCNVIWRKIKDSS